MSFLGQFLMGEIGFPENEIMNVQFFSFEQIEGIKNKLVGEWVYDIISQNK
jgi:hypothetical protein